MVMVQIDHFKKVHVVNSIFVGAVCMLPELLKRGCFGVVEGDVMLTMR